MKKKRKRKGKGKGSAFEREICKRLSLWWTNEDRDDVFWRTSNSGGRATVRGSKRTFGQYGDVQATDPIGQPFIDTVTIEIKRGYSNATLNDFIEGVQKEPQIIKFIKQVIRDSKKADSDWWMLIFKRDYKNPIAIVPYRLVHLYIKRPVKRKGMYFILKNRIFHSKFEVLICGLDWLLDRLDPNKFKD